MISRTSSDFRRDFARLAATIQKQARKAYRAFKADPHHPGIEIQEASAV